MCRNVKTHLFLLNKNVFSIKKKVEFVSETLIEMNENSNKNKNEIEMLLMDFKKDFSEFHKELIQIKNDVAIIKSKIGKNWAIFYIS